MKKSTPTPWRSPTPAEHEFIFREWKFDLHRYFLRSTKVWKFCLIILSVEMLAVTIDMVRLFVQTGTFGYYSTDQGVLLCVIACSLMLLLLFLHRCSNRKYEKVLESLFSGTYMVLDAQADRVRISGKKASLFVNGHKAILPLPEAQRLQAASFPVPCLIITLGKLWRVHLSCVPELDHPYG